MKAKGGFAWLSLGLLAALAVWFCLPVPREKIYPQQQVSLRILDREGNLLREVLSGEGNTSRWVNLNRVSPLLPAATLCAEDKRFYRHLGVDPASLLRAAYQNLRYRRVVSGGSTITQQLARNVYRYPARNWFWKIVEALDALKLERHFSKSQILELYLNRIPYGNQTYGIEAACRLYFDQPSSQLSPAQAAFLAGIPCSPYYYDPYRFFSHAQTRQISILASLLKAKQISPFQYRQALKEEIKLSPREEKFQAPHFCDYALSRLRAEKTPPLSRVRTSLDPKLQREVELLIKSHIARLKENGVTNAAALVMDNHSGEILSMAGSADYFNQDNAGQVNGTTALRQPGSALKPFTYALALERGYTPALLIPDLEIHIPTPDGVYIPRNYDKRFHGPTRMRTALACSYNVCAIWMLQQLGVEQLLEKLHRAGFSGLKQDAAYYGLGLTLGNGEVSLLDLVRGYCALVNQGVVVGDKIFLEQFDERGKSLDLPANPPGANLYSPQVCYLITDILSDKLARARAFGYRCALNLPFPCAAKTGTSRAFTDNWAIGYTRDYTVGVWVGNFNSKPMREVSGITGAAPLFREIMLYLHKDDLPEAFPRPQGISEIAICPDSGELPGPYCPRQRREVFVQGSAPAQTCGVHRLVKIRQGKRLLSRVYEVYPPLYYGWMKSEGLEFPPIAPAVFRPGSAPQTLRIISPAPGDSFKLDPVLRREYQTLALKAEVPEGVERVTWQVNGKTLGEACAPFTYDWKLEKGEYEFKLTARLKGREISSGEVKIQVY